MSHRPADMRFARFQLFLVNLLVLLIFLACTTPSRFPVTSSDNYQEMFDIDLFNERVKLLNSVSPGAGQDKILVALGEPQARQITQEGHMVFIYRVRCYTGPEPSSSWPRHRSLTYENRITFDQQGRVSSSQSIP